MPYTKTVIIKNTTHVVGTPKDIILEGTGGDPTIRINKLTSVTVDLWSIQLDKDIGDALYNYQVRGYLKVILDGTELSNDQVGDLKYGFRGDESSPEGDFEYIDLEGSISGTVKLSPSDETEDWTLTLPIDEGSAGQFLQTDGSGVSSWSDITYTNTTPMPESVGGLSSGTTFSDVQLSVLLDGLLYPYQVPAFSSFSMSGQSSTLEVGNSTLVNPTFTWGTTNSTNIQENSISILDITGSSTIVSGLSNDGSQAVTFSAITKTSASSHVLRISGINTRSDAFTRNLTFSWYWKLYYGTSASAGPLSEANIEALTSSSLSSGFAGSYTFAAGGYKYFCYSSALGTATSFKDSSTMLDVAMESPYTVSVTNSFGIVQNYNVHRTTNVLGSGITIVVA